MSLPSNPQAAEWLRPQPTNGFGLRARGRAHWPLSVVPNSPAHRFVLAVALAGSVLFNATFLIDGFFRPGYSTVQQPMSALSLGPGGWVQATNFIIFGLVTCCSAIGWRATLAPGGGSIWYPRLKVIAGLMLVVAGVFSQDPGLGFPPGVAAPVRASLHANIHNVAAVVSLGATIIGLFVLAWRLRQEPRWRTWSALAALAGLLMVVCLAAFGAEVDHGFGGAFEKAASVTALVFTVSFVGRLLTRGLRLVDTGPAGGDPGVVSPAARTPRTAATRGTNRWRWWLVVLVILGAALTATGGILALDPAGEHLSTAGRNYAEYFFTRNLAMAVLLLGALSLRARATLRALMVLTALIQTLDAVTATATGRMGLVPIDLIFAALFLVGAVHLSSKPPWKHRRFREVGTARGCPAPTSRTEGEKDIPTTLTEVESGTAPTGVSMVTVGTAVNNYPQP